MDTVCNAAKIWRLFKVIRTIPDEESVSWIKLRPRFSKFCTIAGFARIITKQLFEECYRSLVVYTREVIRGMNSRIYRISDAINGVMPSQNAGDTYAQDYTDSELTALVCQILSQDAFRNWVPTNCGAFAALVPTDAL